jgi:hypothetical protein
MWPSFLSVDRNANGIACAVVILLTAGLLLRYGTVFEQEYGTVLTNLYQYPMWRILIVGLLLSAAVWSPAVGLLVALLLFFYLNDMETLLTPFSEL